MSVAIALAAAAAAAAQQTHRPEDTEQWTPVPPVVVPGPVTSPAPPSDAIVLIGGGTGLAAWRSNKGGPPEWTVADDGSVSVRPGAEGIRTVRTFTDYQLHVEWRTPAKVTGHGQGRGNSGVFLAVTPTGAYEIQVLDSYQNPTYVNGMAGSVYKQSAPLANPTRPPGEWQSYDIVWRAPVFSTNGAVLRRARVTVLFNGVLVQDNVELSGETAWLGPPAYHAHGPSPIGLQNHGDPGDPVSFRNMWVRALH